MNMVSKTMSGKLESHQNYFKSGETLAVNARIKILRQLERSIKENERLLLDALKADLNKPEVEAFLSEIYFIIDEINLICKKLAQWLKPKKVGNPIYFLPAKSWVELQPFGTVLIIAPWNYPVQLALAPLIAAVAAGNTVILKPSEVSSEVEKVLIKLISETFPECWVSCVTGGVEETEALLAQDFDFVFFTGSTAVGKKVDAQLAGRLIPRTLELGGKCPCIVDDPKSIEKTASRIVTGKFFNAGQTCFAPDFVAVRKQDAESLIGAIKAELEIRYAKDLDDNIAAPQSAQHAERIKTLRNEENSQLIIIGEDSERCLSPAIIKIKKDSILLEEEIFGPLLPVVEYESEQELWELLDPLNSPLAVYIFSKNQTFINTVVQNFPSGAVCINDTMKQSSNLNLPFGGVGESGLGRYRGKWGIEQFSFLRAYTKRYMVHDLFEISPPYHGALAKMRKLLRWK